MLMPGTWVAWKSVSHNNCHSACQRTELQWIYRDTGIKEIIWATGAEGDTVLTEMDTPAGSIYVGAPGVIRLWAYLVSYHLITERISHSLDLIFWSQSLFLSFCWFSQLCSILSSHPLPMLLEPDPLFLTNSYWKSTRGAPEWWWWAPCYRAQPFHHTGRPQAGGMWEAVCGRWSVAHGRWMMAGGGRPKSWRRSISSYSSHLWHANLDKISRCLTTMVLTISILDSAELVDNWILERAVLQLGCPCAICCVLPMDCGHMCAHLGRGWWWWSQRRWWPWWWWWWWWCWE